MLIAGADPYAGDALGRLALSFEGLAERDRRALASLRGAGIPVCVTLAGGYGTSLDATAAHPRRHDRGRRYLPMNRGGRFSVKACRPSFASSVEKRIANRSTSCTKFAPRSPWSARLVASLA